MRRVAACLAGSVLLLSACGGDDQPTAAPPPAPPPVTSAPSPSPVPGPQAFVSFLRSTNYGSKDLKSAADGPLLALGNTVCSGLDTLPYGRVVSGLRESDAQFTTAQADRIGRMAVQHLCPEKTSALPR